jgi:RNA polymerase sigma-70 factor (ECF subfamily)
MDFDDFYRENYARTVRAMTLTFRDPALAEEITQEAFYRTLRRWPKVSTLDRPDAWTLVVALNCGRDAARKSQRHRTKNRLLARHDSEGSRETAVVDRMTISDLLGAVTDRQRQALVLHYIAQLSVPEMARIMKCAEGTVKSTLHAALQSAARGVEGRTYVTD